MRPEEEEEVVGKQGHVPKGDRTKEFKQKGNSP